MRFAAFEVVAKEPAKDVADYDELYENAYQLVMQRAWDLGANAVVGLPYETLSSPDSTLGSLRHGGSRGGSKHNEVLTAFETDCVENWPSLPKFVPVQKATRQRKKAGELLCPIRQPILLWFTDASAKQRQLKTDRRWT